MPRGTIVPMRDESTRLMRFEKPFEKPFENLDAASRDEHSFDFKD